VATWRATVRRRGAGAPDAGQPAKWGRIPIKAQTKRKNAAITVAGYLVPDHATDFLRVTVAEPARYHRKRQVTRERREQLPDLPQRGAVGRPPGP